MMQDDLLTRIQKLLRNVAHDRVGNTIYVPTRMEPVLIINNDPACSVHEARPSLQKIVSFVPLQSSMVMSVRGERGWRSTLIAGVHGEIMIPELDGMLLPLNDLYRGIVAY